MDQQLRIKTMFVSEVLTETAKFILARQNKVVREWSLFDSGEMEKSLKGHFSVQNQDGGGKLTMRYLSYLRFLDMRDPRRKVQREGFHLYNRIVFGTLYNRTVNTLQWGLTEDVKEVISRQLEANYNTKMPYYKILDVALKEVAKTDRNKAAMFAKLMRPGYR